MGKKEEFLLMTAKNLFEHTSDMIFVKDNDMRYVVASDAFARMAGRERGEDLYGKTDFDLFEHTLATKYTDDDKKLIKLGRPIVNYIEPLPDIDGKKTYSSTSKFLLKDNEGNLMGTYGISRDVTATIELQEERESRELSSRLFEAIFEADLTKDIMIQAEGASWIQSLCFKEGVTYSKTMDKFANTFLYPEFVESFKALYDRDSLLASAGVGGHSFNVICIHKIDGQNPRYLELKSRMFFSRVSNTVKLTIFFKDIDEEYKKKEALKVKAATDNLTGLYNRDGIEQKIIERLNRGHSNRALLFLDIDCFKQLNDTFGHLYGDRVLKEIADKLKNLSNGSHLVGRFGGDEFVVFIEDFVDMQQLEVEVHKVIAAAQYFKYENGMQISITCSLGISLYTEGKTMQCLYEEADKAMYFSKKHGKNCYAFYDNIYK